MNRSFSYGYDSVPGAAFLWRAASPGPGGRPGRGGGRGRPHRPGGCGPRPVGTGEEGVYGSRVRSLNSFETLCIGQAQSFFAGSDLLRFPEMFRQIAREDVEALIALWAVPERLALSVIRPGEEVQV